MKVSVVDVSASQKRLQVEIPAQVIQKEIDKKYNELAKQVRIKGFRPGKVPRKILKSYYGKSIEGEVSSRFIQETFPQALRETELKPLTEANVDDFHFEEDGSFTYEAVVEVCPPFEVEGYRGLELERPSAEVSEKEVTDELEKLREQKGQLQPLDSERPIQKGDVVVVDFLPWVEGEPLENARATDQMMEIGKENIHPEFETQLLGHSAGEDLSFEIDFDDDVPNKDIAGKRVRFDVTIKEVKEKMLPELDDAFAQSLGPFETLEALKEEIRGQLRKMHEQNAQSQVRQQIQEQLLDKVSLELSPKAIQKEVDALVEQFKYQFQSQGMDIDTSRLDTPQIRAEYRPQAERNLKWRMIVEQIAAQEGVELGDEEMEEVYSDVARLLKKDVGTVKSQYADSGVVEQVKGNRIQEKVFELVEREAVYKTPSPDDENQENDL